MRRIRSSVEAIGWLGEVYEPRKKTEMRFAYLKWILRLADFDCAADGLHKTCLRSPPSFRT